MNLREFKFESATERHPSGAPAGRDVYSLILPFFLVAP